MQSLETTYLYNLAVSQVFLIRKAWWNLKTLKVCIDWSYTRYKLEKSLTRIIDELEYAVVDTWKDNKKVDKDVERGLKHSLISSGSEELKLIVEELKPYSGDHHWLVTKSIGSREYKLELEKLIELLLNPDAGTIVPVLGKSCVGKSTLLRLAFNDSRIQNHFTSTIYLDYQNKYVQDDSLVKVLDTENLHGRKMLIAIDNIKPYKLQYFSENQDQSSYKDLVKRAGQESKIVITSRLEPEKIGADISPTILMLSGLSPSESCNLFIRTAFPNEENLGERLQTLSSLSLQICEKCGKVPGVIVIIAAILSFKNSPDEWKHFLDVTMTSVPDLITTVTYVLQWTQCDRYSRGTEYYHRIKREWYRMFAWCSLLPKDYTFTKNNILNLLMAQFMTKRRTTKLEEWFDDMVMNKYFVEFNGGDTTVRYKISSLGYELMKHVAGDDYCLMDDPAVEIHHKIIRHLSFIVDASWEPPSWLPQAKFLQSLWLWPRKSGDTLSLSKINSVLSRIGTLCALHAEVVHCERIPQFLGELKNLKYLRLGVVSTISLPDDIPHLDKLLNCNPYYTGLINKKSRAQRILNLLENLTSRMLIIQPDDKYNVLGTFEVVQNFMKYLNVQSITVSSFHGKDEKLKSENLFQSLEILKVRCWTGEKWPTDDKLLSILTYNLVSIQFEHCRSCRRLPAFSSLPHLSLFQLRGMCSLEEILTIDEKREASSTRTFYPSLKTLVLFDLPKSKGWSSHKEGDCFPLLAQVRIRGCPNLMSMPFVPVLKSLEAININAKLMRHLIYPHESTLSSTISTPMTNHVSSQGSTPSPLTNMEIDGCLEFDLADKEIWLAFSRLRSLKLNNISKLVSLPDGLECSTTLEQLSLCWLTNLKALPEWMTKLRRLTIHYCVKLTKLTNSFSGLEQLDIRYCPRLSHYPESLPNLKRLRILEICRFEQILGASQNLEELEIDNCQDWENDTQSSEGDSSVAVWKGHNKLRSFKMTKMEEFPKSIDFEQMSELRHLTINSCPKITTLPELFCSLSALEYLYIKSCRGLTQLPDAFKNLGSLKHIDIQLSPLLEKRYKEQGGEDWHLIQHIPVVICGKKENSPPSSTVSSPYRRNTWGRCQSSFVREELLGLEALMEYCKLEHVAEV